MHFHTTSLKLACTALLCLLQNIYAAADYQFEVVINSYSNPREQDSVGDCCDSGPFCTSGCDPYFDTFCLRSSGHSHNDLTTCSLGSSGRRIESLPATVTIAGTGPWPGGFQLYIRVQDEDTFTPDDLIDRIFAESNIRPSSTFSNTLSFRGDFGIATLGLRFRVTCSQDYYGLDCDTFCRPRGHYDCDGNGNIVCLSGFTGETCTTNINDCEGANCPENSMCVDGVNSFECVGNPGFQCEESDSSYICVCASGFTGENCTTNINDCEGANCPENSMCVDGINSFECVCNPGSQCEESESEAAVSVGLAIGLLVSICICCGCLCAICLCVVNSEKCRWPKRTPVVRTVTSSTDHTSSTSTRGSSSLPTTQANQQHSGPKRTPVVRTVTSSTDRTTSTTTRGSSSLATTQMNQQHSITLLPRSEHQAQPRATPQRKRPPDPPNATYIPHAKYGTSGMFNEPPPPSYAAAVGYPQPQVSNPLFTGYPQEAAVFPPPSAPPRFLPSEAVPPLWSQSDQQ